MRTPHLLAAAMLALAGCTPLPPPPPPPLVAYPAPGKPPAIFAQDDAACRVPPPTPADRPAAVTTADPAAPQQVPLPPQAAYLQCMAAHGNIILPLVPPRPAYAYLGPPPFYAYGDYDPFFTGGFGVYGGCCFGRGGFGGGHFHGYR